MYLNEVAISVCNTSINTAPNLLGIYRGIHVAMSLKLYLGGFACAHAVAW